MKCNGYDNISHRLDADKIELGWLNSISDWNSNIAVPIKPHSHPYIELIFCLKGRLSYRIEGYGQVSICECSGIVIPANTIHVLNDETDSPCQRIGLHIRQKISPTGRYAIFSAKDIASFRATLLKMAAKPFRIDKKLQLAVNDLSQLINTDHLSPARLGLLRALCCTILCRTADTLSKPLVPTKPKMMHEAVKFLETHASEKIRLEDLVHRMGYSRSQLFYLFKLHTGLSPNEYLVRYRIHMAQKLMHENKLSVADIAKACGFSTTAYFRSVFLKYTGRKA
jgi:AraC-like DNA-binding protein